ncbi:MAG: hypothetical protein J0I68_30890 [Achromobacter sp.]|uniref:hypothetical protein n=1 Tax=Achromobacter sp. TaxID=134375 RepID=UPI001AD51558|nr:hypothetical protein [Achromobacter sp.]MBN9642972.1 hypothetical protein [Achromobacter sp.]
MAQPPAYNRTKDFATDYPDQTDNQAINNELDGVSLSVNGIRKNLALIQRDDGGLRNNIVTKDALSPELTDELYAEFSGNINDAVLQAQQAAVEADNSAQSAANDAASAAAAKTDAQAAANGAQASAAEASVSQVAAAASSNSASSFATAAAASASASAGSQTAAANSASAAAGSASVAQGSASNSLASATAAETSATTASNQATAAASSASAAAGSATAAGNSATAAGASAGLAQDWAIKTSGPVSGGEFSAKYYATLAAAAQKWATRGVGELVLIWDHLAGADVPPTNNPDFRYIKLTASSSYNSGVLTSESVAGSAPLLTATAIISLAGSPMNGSLVYLINTERRAVRAGASGDIQDDAFQRFALRARRGSGAVGLSADAMGSSDGSLSVGISSAGYYVETTANVVFDAPSGGASVRTAVETRMRNIGASFYMRVK